MKKLSPLFLVVAGILGSFFSAHAQNNDPVLIRINDYQILQSEFTEVYRKNNLEMEVPDPKSVDDYLELFLNFKLKVLEAQSLGLDTNEAFLNELSGYREQLARPYFYDQDVSDQLLQEAYERMLFDIRASHILVAVDEHAPSKDTLEAYNRIMSIYERVQGGADFEDIARKESDDPSARDRAASANGPAFRGNAGDLGYFTVLNMVYPFETAAYQTPPGQVSKPVRSPFGYHIIRVTDRLPAMGRVQAAHIMVNSPLGTTTSEAEKHEQKINELYQRLLGGEDFAALATEFSDDGASARRNGQLPEFTSNRMVPEFIKTINDLKNVGDFSPPVKTNFGWHIVMLLDRKAPESFEEEYFELKNRVSRDSRTKLSREVVLNRLKQEYGFRDYQFRLQDIINLVDQEIFEGKWEPANTTALQGELLSFAGNSFSQQHFIDYLKQTQGMRTPEGILPYVMSRYHTWVETLLIEYEDSRLEDKYPGFQSIMKEYHDGILLFELTDKLVWSRAVEDTAGLEAFYSEQQNKHMWGDRLHATIYLCKDDKTARSTLKAAKNAAKKGNGYQEVLKLMNAQAQTDISAREGIFEFSEDSLIDSIPWKQGWVKPFSWNGRVAIVQVHEVLPAQPKQLNDIRGLVIADYQNFLEKQWVEQLRAKYQITVDKDVLQNISF